MGSSGRFGEVHRGTLHSNDSDGTADEKVDVDLDQGILDAWSIDLNHRARQLAAENPGSSHESLLRLSTDSKVAIKAAVAQNPSTTAEILDQLSKVRRFNSEQIHAAVASNPNTNADTLSFLGQSENLDVRKAVAENPNTPAEVAAAINETLS